MRSIVLSLALCLASSVIASTASQPGMEYGPAAALRFELRYKGDCCEPGCLHCYPKARPVLLADCANIIPMTASLWTPGQLCTDFRRRMSSVPENARKEGIIVMLKTERCATKIARACAVTTAALEKRSTPLVGDFLVYAVQIKPRDGDNPPGSLQIEAGADSWKNQAAGKYRFEQGPGATLVLLDPHTGSKVGASNAAALKLLECSFIKDQGRTPELEEMLREGLRKIQAASVLYRTRSKVLGYEFSVSST